MLSLQFVYLLLENDPLNELTQSWNYHGLSTKSNKSPWQLWIVGVLSNSHTDLVAVDNELQDEQSCMNEFGIDEEEDTPELQACKDVSVPECPIKMSDKQEEVLRRIPGSITDDKYGIQQYFSTVDYMKSLH